ncbi:MAG: PadR family transcriptional regulator [Hyphomicrobiales bacterium]
MAERDPRLSGPTLKVLKLFLEAPREKRSGAAISREAKLGSGTLYPLLARLEQAGWLASEWEEIDPSEAGRPRRRYYSLTALGQSKAKSAFDELQLPSFGLFPWMPWLR